MTLLGRVWILREAEESAIHILQSQTAFSSEFVPARSYCAVVIIAIQPEELLRSPTSYMILSYYSVDY